MLYRLLLRLGDDPTKSWTQFKRGLAGFAAGVCLLLLGAGYWMWLQIPGLLLLVIGFVIAIRGYIGIFANRFAHTLNRMSAPAGRDKHKQNNFPG